VRSSGSNCSCTAVGELSTTSPDHTAFSSLNHGSNEASASIETGSNHVCVRCTTLKTGAAATGRTAISTLLPRRLENPISFSKEKIPTRPRSNSETRGCPIPRRSPVCACVRRRREIFLPISRTRSALARRSSGLGSPRSAKTLPLPSMTFIRFAVCPSPFGSKMRRTPRFEELARSPALLHRETAATAQANRPSSAELSGRPEP